MIIDEHNQKAIELFLDTADPGGNANFWIGLTDLFEEGNFVWSDGDKSTYQNWLPGEPNNGRQGNEHFGHIWTKGVHQRKWNDWLNEAPVMALCQFVL